MLSLSPEVTSLFTHHVQRCAAVHLSTMNSRPLRQLSLDVFCSVRWSEEIFTCLDTSSCDTGAMFMHYRAGLWFPTFRLWRICLTGVITSERHEVKFQIALALDNSKGRVSNVTIQKKLWFLTAQETAWWLIELERKMPFCGRLM